MIDQEKVIKELERCVLPHGRGCTPECEYHGRIECCRQVMRKALALLKEQEPHVMTLKKAIDAEVCWIEQRGQWAPPIQPCTVHNLGRILRCQCLGDKVFDVRRADHNIRFRFWTSDPTDDQRKAVKWDD